MATSEHWVELDVCGTCMYGAAYGGDQLTEDDQRSLDGLAKWWEGGWYLFPSCDHENDDCEGFTWSPCDVCGQTGRASHKVLADPAFPPASERAS